MWDFLFGQKVTRVVTREFEEVDIIDPNKFMKILIKCGIEQRELRNYTWYVTQVGIAKYKCDGYHPVGKRIIITKDNIVIH
jgi:hypothetical protein